MLAVAALTVAMSACEGSSVGPAATASTLSEASDTQPPVSSTTSSAAGSTSTSTAGPRVDVQLVEEALEILETHALVRDEIDWQELRAATIAPLDSESSDADIYAAIANAVGAVSQRDSHSFFSPTTTASSREDASQPAIQDPIVELRENIGYIKLAGFQGTDRLTIDRFAAGLREEIQRLDDAGVCGWVVDLWGHTGGNMWPAVGGLAPILGDDVVGHFIGPDSSLTPWIIRDDAVYTNETPVVSLDANFDVTASDSPVGVVIGPETRSAGEAVALAFRGRPDTQLFGQFTSGSTSAVQVHELSDGSILGVATAFMADRNQDAPGLFNPISPDTIVPDLFDPEPAITEASAWVQQQPKCTETK